MPIRTATGEFQTTETPARVTWEGSFLVHHSLANVNRELALALMERDVSLALVPFEPDQFDEKADGRFAILRGLLNRRHATTDVYVRHRWPPDFARPDARRFVLIQPWEFGSLPEVWVDGIAANVDEVWAYTEYVKEVYVRSGVPEQMVKVVPLGVNTDLFNSQVPPADIATKKAFKFLFIGGTIGRKGFDILLQAYCEEFTAEDDVCLIVKDFFYGGQGKEQIAASLRRPGAPEILYDYSNVDYHQVAQLYTACDAYVHPYRGEGFGLPIAEAMACGLPVLVTDGGAARDFCNESNAFLVPSRKVWLPEKRVDNLATVDYPSWLEPDRAALRKLMRYVFENREAARQRGQAAYETILTRLTWQHAAEAALSRIEALTDEARRPEAQLSPRLSMNLARAALRQGDFAKAGTHLRSYLASRPDDAVAHNSLAFALFNLGKTEEALAEARRSVEVDDSYEEGHQNVGAIELARGRPWKALGPLARALELRPDYADAADNLRDVVARLSNARPKGGKRKPESVSRLAELKRAERALRRFRETLASPQPAATETPKRPTVSLCMIVKNEEQFLPRCLKSVKGHVDEIVVVDTGSTDRTVEVAESFGAKVFHHPWKDDFSEARNAATQHATCDWILYLDADECLPEGEGPKVQEAALTPDVGGLCLPIDNYLRDGGGGDVLRHFATRMYRRLPGARFTGRIHEEITPSLYEMGLPVAFANILINHYGYRPDVVSSRGKMERTYNLLHQQLSEEPDNAFHIYNLANTYQCDGRWEEACEYYARAAEKVNRFAFYAPSVYSGWATCLYSLKRYEESAERCRMAVELRPDHPEGHYTMGLNYNALARYDEAIECFHRAIEYGKTFTIGISDMTVAGYKAFFSLGQAYLAKGEYDQAEEWLLKTLEVRPDFDNARFHLGLVYHQTNRRDEAQREFEAALSLNPGHEEAANNLAQLLMARGELIAAAAILERVLELAPTSVSAHCNLGNCYNTLGDSEKAERHYRAALEADPGRAEVHNNLGVVLSRLGRNDEAHESYRLAVQLKPDYAEAYSNLGVLCFDQGASMEALQFFKHALRCKPNHTNALLNLGRVYEQAGMAEEALNCYESAVRVDPTNSVLFLRLGHFYNSREAWDAGIACLQKALELRPSFPEAAEALQTALVCKQETAPAPSL